MVAFMVFILGLAIGSFLNAFIYRLEVCKGLVLEQVKHKVKHKPSVFRGRSFCPHCGHTLAWHDLVPLLSFLMLRGRCRYCKRQISWQYPFIELTTGFLFVAIFIYSVDGRPQNILYLGYLWAITALLIGIFVYDLKHYLIPNKVVYAAISLALLWRGFEQFGFGILSLFRISDFGFWISLPFVQASITGILASAFFFAIFWFSRGRAMGFGDVKLAFLLGLFLGWPAILVALFSAFCLGAAVGLILIALRKKGLKSEVPFAPFLITGTAIAFFFGSDILNWYLGLFLV